LVFFGDRILWINLISEEIEKLHKIIDKKLGDFFSHETRFHNHITIARIKHIENKQKLQTAIEKIPIEKKQFKINSFHFKKSTLTPNGPIYETLEEFQFSHDN